MKFNKLLLINLLITIYLEVLFKCIVFKDLFSFNSLYLLMFSFFVAFIFTFILRFIPKKTSKVLLHVLWGIISIIFISEFVYFKYYNTVIGLSGLEYTSQIMAFKSAIFQVVLSHLHIIILFLVPSITLIFIRKFIDIERYEKKELLKEMLVFIILIFITFSTFLFKSNVNREVLFKKNNMLLTTDRFGLINGLSMDGIKMLLNFKEEAVILNIESEKIDKEVKYNVTEIDFNSIISAEENENINNMHKYFSSVTPTKQNEYTGMFKGKNLIYIVAEAFYPIAINEELTPTLYKMSKEGFNFTNFYQPIYGCSTSDGEFTSLYSLLPGASTCTMKKTSDKYYPYALGNIFGESYKSLAFHGGTYKYYSRNKTLPNLGFSYYACGNGLNINCKSWPQSDVEMVQDSLRYYINEDKFVTYYMSISGHLEYNFYGNLIAKKNKKLVADMETSEAIKAYMATQIEFDRSLELLINELKKAGALEDTVIAIVPDHYPYGLDTEEIVKYMGLNDTTYDLYKNSFILWNSKMEESIKIDKYASNIDVIPTLLNLFGIEYDSRLLIGKDILSDSEGIVMFNNFNWINEYGKYNYVTNTFTPHKNKSLSKEEIDKINVSIQNKFTMSKLIVLEDYYRKLFK